jgi:hypothetical protein
MNGRIATPQRSSYTKDGLPGFVHPPKLGTLGVRKHPTASSSHASPLVDSDYN